jgi:hypothetical protein
MAIAAFARSSCFLISGFPSLGLDATFPSVGLDAAFPSVGLDAAFSSVDLDAIRQGDVGEDSVILPATVFVSDVCDDRCTKEETGAILIESSSKCDTAKINARPILLQDIVDDVFVDNMIMDDGIGISDKDKRLLLGCRLLYKLFSLIRGTMSSDGVVLGIL